MLKDSQRRAIAFKILDALESGLSEGRGLTWKQIASRTGIVPDTLNRYLNDMKSIGMVLHQDGLYAFDPKYLGWFVGERAEFIQVNGLASQIKTTEDVLDRIDLDFERSYFQYIKLLKSIVEAPTRSTAHRLFELTFTLDIEPRLLKIARFVWEKRNSIKIEKIDPFQALIRFRPIVRREEVKQ
jgi:transcriptional regulator with XRE-family HTH domain